MNTTGVTPAGRILSNYSTQALTNNTAATAQLTVPEGCRWLLHGGRISNADSVARNCYVRIRDAAAGNTVLYCLASVSIAAGADSAFPTNTAVAAGAGHGIYPIPLKAGWVIEFYWAAGGASAGGTAQYSALLLEVPE